MTTPAGSGGWTRARLGWMFAPVVRKDHADEPVLSVYRDHGVVPKASRTDNFNRTPADLDAYQLVEPGDVVVNRMKAWQGSVAVSAHRGIVSPDYEVLKPLDRDRNDARFIHHLLRSRGLIEQYAIRSTGIRPSQWRLYWDDMKAIDVSLPPLDDQRRIADFLERETSQIDLLILKQNRLVANVRERRKALVEHAVFGRLDAANFKPTPSEWLPVVPTHWNVVPLGSVAETLAGWAFPSEEFSAAPPDTRLVRGVNVKPGRTDWSDTVYWDAQANPVPPEFALEEGDLVLGMDRPFVRGGVRVAPISSADLPALLLQRVLRLRPKPHCDRDYLRYVATSSAFLFYLEPLFTGVSVPHISEWQVRKFRMPLPPREEQTRIASYLDDQTAKIDVLVAKTERFIALAQERRSALITAAVTGRIDVRDKVV